jgi:radical SAM superfamily enzyme YgiQ (UPF0313 family)
MIDVLLTHSNHLFYDRKQVRKMEPYPPLGTLYAAAFLRSRGISVAVFDATFQQPEAGLADALRAHNPKIVVIYEDDFNFLTKMCLTRMRELAFHMIDASRRHGARVVVHGSDATDHATDFLRQGAGCVLVGEAENSLLHVVKALLRNSSMDAIPGVKQLKQVGPRQIVETCYPRHSHQASSLPHPARDLIDIGPYRDAWKKAHQLFSLNLISSRGCPFQCNWCAKPIFGDSYQLRPAIEVADEMRVLKHRYAADHLWFADDIFGLNRHWLAEFALAVEGRDCAGPFKVQARADLITAATARDLKQAGCAEVWMGVESGSQKVLDAMDKGLLVEEVIAARNHLRREGIRTCYFLQLGYPGERYSDIQKTIALVRETRPDDIGVSFSYPLPNTRFHARVKVQLGAKQNWSDSEDLCVMFKGAYTDQFYRAIRDALHAEVASWQAPTQKPQRQREIADLWNIVATLEPSSRNPDATELPKRGHDSRVPRFSPNPYLIPLNSLSAAAGDVND